MLTRIEPWTRSCRRVVLYDLRGHGETQGGGSRMGCGEHSDLLTLLDRLGGGPFVLVGHGLGGVISLAAEANATEAEIAGVAVAEPYPGLRVWLTNRLRSARCPAALRAPALLWLRLAGIRDPGTAQRVAIKVDQFGAPANGVDAG